MSRTDRCATGPCTYYGDAKCKCALSIPETHWRSDGILNWRAFVPDWEEQLRTNIRAEMDPAARFAAWLQGKANGAGHSAGARLVFIEQPYLDWAETVERLIVKTEKDMRELIADEVRRQGHD